MKSSLLEKQSSNSDWGFDYEKEAQIIAGIKKLKPLIQSEAQAGELAKSPTAKVVEALDELNAWCLVTPKRIGGCGLSATGMMRVSAELAKCDPSVAWVSQIVNGTTWVSSLGPDRLQEALFGDGVPKIIGAFNPPGIAKPVDGGYLVSGQWPYASGFRLASWGQWGVKIVHPDGTEVLGNFCYIPTKDMTLLDTWVVPGLQGTGSDTAMVKDIFVPEHLMVHVSDSFGNITPDKKHVGAPSDYFTQIALVHRTHAGVLLGAAEGLLDCVIEAARERPMVGTMFSRQMDSQVVVRDIGEIAATLDTARVLLEVANQELDQAALNRYKMTEPERAKNKVKSSHAIKMLDQSVQSLMFIAGSSAYNRAKPMSRYWSDFNVGSRHFAHIPNVAYEVYGRTIFDIQPNVMPTFMI